VRRHRDVRRVIVVLILGGRKMVCNAERIPAPEQDLAQLAFSRLGPPSSPLLRFQFETCHALPPVAVLHRKVDQFAKRERIRAFGQGPELQKKALNRVPELDGMRRVEFGESDDNPFRRHPQ